MAQHGAHHPPTGPVSKRDEAAADWLPDDIVRRLRADFAGQTLAGLESLLAEYHGHERARVQRCIVYLAGGDERRLRDLIAAANIDYRDLIYGAEYGPDDSRLRDFTQPFDVEPGAAPVERVTWRELSFLPDAQAMAELAAAWSWRLPSPFEPVMASTLGDVFFQSGGDEVYRLDTGTAEIQQVAPSRPAFVELLKTDKVDDWFMPALVSRLIAAGKKLEPGQCYTYVTLPIFEQGRYEVANLNPVPAREHFGLTGELHRQLAGLAG